MNPVQRSAFDAEISSATASIAEGSLISAFQHLERAHVIGQAHVVPHVITHWHMFKVALKQRDLIAAWGQVVRIVLGALGSAVNVVPTGNTGGSNVSMFKRMPIEPEIRDIIEGRAPNHSLKPRGPAGSRPGLKR